MTQTTDALDVDPAMEAGLRLSAAQTMAAEAFQEANESAMYYREQVKQLTEDVEMLSGLLPVKQAALARAKGEYDVMRKLLAEHFSLYRDLMELTPSLAAEIEPPG